MSKREKMKSNKGGFTKKCKDLDIFGFPVTLVHSGRPMFKTEVGSVFTILLGIILLTFVSMKLKNFVLQDQDQKYNKFVADRNLYDPTESVNLKQKNFEFAFGSLDRDIPINIGRFVP